MNLPGWPVHLRKPSRSPSGAHPKQSPEAAVETIRKRLQVVVINQERLSRSRGELLDRREEIRILVKEVQSLRKEAGDANAAFMSYLRTLAIKDTDEGVYLGKDVIFTELYNSVESTRDRLGVKEDELEQTGRALTAEELRFREEEDNFYQYDLPELLMRDVALMHRPPPPPPPSRLSPLPFVHLDRSEHDSLSTVIAPPPPLPLPCPLSPLQPPRQFWWPSDKPRGFPSEHMNDDVEFDALGRQFGPKVEQIPSSLPNGKHLLLNMPSILKPDGPSSCTISTTSYPRELTSSDISDIETEHTQHDEPRTEFFASTADRRSSDPVKYGSNMLGAPQLLERSLSENALIDTDHKPSTKHRIREWLLTLLRLNKIEKTQYQNILKETLIRHGFHYPNGLPWVESATFYWSRDSRSSFGTVFDDNPSSSSFGSKTSVHTTSDAEPSAIPCRRRRSTRTHPPVEPLATEALILNTNDPSEAEIDHPSFFPLPGSPSQETDESSDIDDPSYFPLPLSLSSSLTDDNSIGNNRTRPQPLQSTDVPTPLRPTELSRNFTGHIYSTEFGTYTDTFIPVTAWRYSKSDTV
jgi:hypothetical protein